jgi:hypothetical protein
MAQENKCKGGSAAGMKFTVMPAAANYFAVCAFSYVVKTLSSAAIVVST